MILDEIYEHKVKEVEAAKLARPQRDIEQLLNASPTPRDFRGALRSPGISLIAEIKKASPVKGVFLEDVDPVQLGQLYQDSGAHVISVLTDTNYFQGSLDDLINVRSKVEIPCLRKEFILDPYQIIEARVAGADAILLIVRMLDDIQLKEFHSLATELGMGVLVETHEAPEVERALDIGAHIIGINNRNLDTFEVDINTTQELKKMIPGGKVLVSESGIRSGEEVRILHDTGVDAILVGESIVRSDNITAKIHELLLKNES